MGVMTKFLIEDSTMVRKLLGLARIRVMGTTRAVATLESSGMFVIA